MADQVASGGVFSPWPRSRRIRAVRSFLSRGAVLDVGCGSGALADYCSSDRYLGVERDSSSLEAARRTHPRHQFLATLPDDGTWDVIVMLAVVEHLAAPSDLLTQLRQLAAPAATLVMTTPHPSFGWFHHLGAQLGLFSRDADAEHETLFDRVLMASVCAQSGRRLEWSRRFLFGANQLFLPEKGRYDGSNRSCR